MQIIRNARRIAAAAAALALTTTVAQAQFTFTGNTRGCFYGAAFGGTTSCTPGSLTSTLGSLGNGSLTFTGATLNQLAIDNSASFNTSLDNFGTFTLVPPVSGTSASADGNFFTLMLTVTNPSAASGSMMASVTGRVNSAGASNVNIDFSGNDWFSLSPASSGIQAKLNDVSVAAGVTNFANGQLRAVPAVVPEPSTYALMGAGLAGLVGMARRRRTVA